MSYIFIINNVIDLIKNGQNSGSIEITLFNESDTSYNKAFYGNEITVIRKINEKTSDYKFLSEKGKISLSLEISI